MHQHSTHIAMQLRLASSLEFLQRQSRHFSSSACERTRPQNDESPVAWKNQPIAVSGRPGGNCTESTGTAEWPCALEMCPIAGLTDLNCNLFQFPGIRRPRSSVVA